MRALVRKPEASQARALARLGIELVAGDLAQPETFPAAVAGSDVIIHAATDTTLTDKKVAQTVAVDATRELYEQAARSGVKRFIFISSLAVYGGMEGVLSESVQPQPWGEIYGDLKIAAERSLLELSQKPGFPELTILRFPSVYGPNQSRWTLEPLKQARQNRLMIPGTGQFPFAYLYEEGMIEVMTAAVTSSHFGIYNIVEGGATYLEFMRSYADMVGTKVKFIPAPMLMMVAFFSELKAALTGQHALVNRKVIRRMLDFKPGTSTPMDKARDELGWSPRLTLAEGMARIKEQIFSSANVQSSHEEI
ncbi:MAG: NAD-dependent epimerase/dehydratase family protein [Chloroflexi bacterium]|nr:NAD-dependent epimerase/dehydratase family protein [Chloroflexota bacterium]